MKSQINEALNSPIQVNKTRNEDNNQYIKSIDYSPMPLNNKRIVQETDAKKSNFKNDTKKKSQTDLLSKKLYPINSPIRITDTLQNQKLTSSKERLQNARFLKKTIQTNISQQEITIN